jgi:hypothetical protein
VSVLTQLLLCSNPLQECHCAVTSRARSQVQHCSSPHCARGSRACWCTARPYPVD